MRNIKNIPTEIYLQIGAGASECGDFAALTSSDVTWHTERIFANDIRYVLPKDVKTKGGKKIYISGAISHLDLDERRAAFAGAEELLTGKGYEVFNPFKNGVSQDEHWREHMRVDLAALPLCDAIYMLDGWETSKGAKLEFDVASTCGLKIYYQSNKLIK